MFNSTNSYLSRDIRNLWLGYGVLAVGQLGHLLVAGEDYSRHHAWLVLAEVLRLSKPLLGRLLYEFSILGALGCVRHGQQEFIL